PLGITLLFNTVHFRADIFVLTLTRPTIEVGIYGLATKFFEFPLAIPTFFMNAVYPLLLTSLSNDNKKQWSRMIRESAMFLVSFSLLVVVAGYVLAPLLVTIKEEFAASILPFRILVFTLPLFFLSSLFMWILIAQGKTWQLVWVYGIAMVVNVVLNVMFIPQFGYTAAAIITGISEGVVLLLLGWNLRSMKFAA
ncbi:MAG: polysaccharide biosynthesis C-terminal domain-containing protein, partial [Candidatus Paceibacterota bacterium]